MKRPPLGRLAALLAALFLGLAGILARLTFLQVRDAEAYQSMAQAQRARSVTIPAERGAILDRNGAELALSVAARDVYVHPQSIPDPEEVAEELATILGVETADVLEKLRDDDPFVYLARQVDLETAARIERLEIPGVGLLRSSKRFYPNGALAPHVLGFVGIDHIGLSGLELQHDDDLSGTHGGRTIEIDPSGHAIPQGSSPIRVPVPGNDLLTTIDREIQHRAQIVLRQAIEENGAKGGTVLVMDPRSGEILALATWPWFDPNRFADAPQERLRAIALSNMYEPGSVNKIVTAAAAIEERIRQLSKRVVVPDTVEFEEYVISDSHEHPPTPMTIADIVAESSNVGTIGLAAELGAERLAEYLERFGLGRPTGIAFPGESPGSVPEVEGWSDASMGTIPIGQGIAVTVLQMAMAYAAVANDGVWVQPSFVRGSVDPEGNFMPAPRPDRHRVVSSRTAGVVKQILSHAVVAGTGSAAQIPGYWVAGKTGTAMIPRSDGPGYYSGRYIASFTGFAPAADPRVLVAVMMQEPETVYGSVAAAPVFKKVARYALHRLRVPPEAPLPSPPHAIRAE